MQSGNLDLDKATKEAQRLDSLGFLADAFTQAKTIESSVIRLYSAWRRLGDLNERLWVESGASTPHLRDVINTLQKLGGTTMRVPLGELFGGKKIRLQIVEEQADQLDPPSI